MKHHKNSYNDKKLQEMRFNAGQITLKSISIKKL